MLQGRLFTSEEFPTSIVEEVIGSNAGSGYPEAPHHSQPDLDDSLKDSTFIADITCPKRVISRRYSPSQYGLRIGTYNIDTWVTHLFCSE